MILPKVGQQFKLAGALYIRIRNGNGRSAFNDSDVDQIDQGAWYACRLDGEFLNDTNGKDSPSVQVRGGLVRLENCTDLSTLELGELEDLALKTR